MIIKAVEKARLEIDLGEAAPAVLTVIYRRPDDGMIEEFKRRSLKAMKTADSERAEIGFDTEAWVKEQGQRLILSIQTDATLPEWSECADWKEFVCRFAPEFFLDAVSRFLGLARKQEQTEGETLKN